MAQTRSKRYKESASAVTNVPCTIEDAVKILKSYKKAKFDESVEVNFQLGIDPKQPTQVVRGTVALPHGTGKTTRVIVFCAGEEAREAQAAGAEYVGGIDLINKVAGGWIDFDVVIAHPTIMREMGKLGKVLGPRGLMPSPKVGTVTQDVGKAVAEVKKGKIEVKSDKTSGLHLACGKMSFSAEKIADNIRAVIKAVTDMKPQSARGVYLRRVTLSTTMGPGVEIELSSIANIK